jgi:S1-C subfamily serine protease
MHIRVGGDVLVQLGTHQIRNLYDMPAALNAYHPDDTVGVALPRDGQRVESRATLRTRGG